MFDRLFLKHPRSVEESYLEHFGVASRFGFHLLRAGIACLIHALVPAWCERTGSSTVKRLYGEMKQRQPKLASEPPAYLSQEWQLEYEI
jgi:hypothetical protein